MTRRTFSTEPVGEASHVAARLAQPFAFYDDAGSLRQWVMGQRVSDADEIAMLKAKSAPIVDIDISAEVPSPGSKTTEEVLTVYRAAVKKHGTRSAVAAFLDGRLREFRQQLGSVQSMLDDAMTPSVGSEREQARASQRAVLVEAYRLFAHWDGMSTDQANLQIQIQV